MKKVLALPEEAELSPAVESNACPTHPWPDCLECRASLPTEERVFMAMTLTCGHHICEPCYEYVIETLDAIVDLGETPPPNAPLMWSCAPALDL